jgi:hypothetical protein
MPQNEMTCLILEAMDYNNSLKQSRILLDIAVEQLALKDNSKTFERVEVLLDEYVSAYNLHFEELEWILNKLRKASIALDKDSKYLQRCTPGCSPASEQS